MIYRTQSSGEATIVPQVEELIGYKFNNKKLCWEALQGKGANGYAQGNKRLALVGDAMIRLKVLEGWYPTHTPTVQGNDMVEARVKNRRLGSLGNEISLERFIIPNPSQRGHVEESLVADTMEALVGAVYADGGEKSIDVVMEKLGI